MDSLPDLELDAAAVQRLHDAMLSAGRSDGLLQSSTAPPAHGAAAPVASPGQASQRSSGVWHWIERNHRCNGCLWDEEDRARRTDVADAEIVRCKRSIDRYNQQRNDAVEAIDVCLLEAIGEAPAGAVLHSETPGAMIDRLSILSLKIHHMRHESERREAGAEHMRSCAAKLERLVQQRRDLSGCLDRLLRELAAGRACFRLYRQFKMYNDPALNPCLYHADPAPSAARRAGQAAHAQAARPGRQATSPRALP
jgi:hypothetical protein